jgi:hypothetical protein
VTTGAAAMVSAGSRRTSTTQSSEFTTCMENQLRCGSGIKFLCADAVSGLHPHDAVITAQHAASQRPISRSVGVLAGAGAGRLLHTGTQLVTLAFRFTEVTMMLCVRV